MGVLGSFHDFIEVFGRWEYPCGSAFWNLLFLVDAIIRGYLYLFTWTIRIIIFIKRRARNLG